MITATHPKRLAIEEWFASLAPESPVICLDGLDEAILGIGEQHDGVGPVVAYSMTLIIECFESDGMDHEEAVEWFTCNYQCLSVGEGTPIIVDDYSFPELIPPV